MNKNILKSNSSFMVIGKSPAWLPTNYESGRLFSLTQAVGFEFQSNKLKTRQLGYQHYSSDVDYQTPQANLSLDYYFSPYLNNELLMGFNVSGVSGIPCLSGFKNKNYNFYFLSNEDDFVDGFTEIRKATGLQNWSDGEAICFGNCHLESYALSIGLGSVPKVSVKFKASNVAAETLRTGTTGTAPYIQIPALDPYSGKLQTGALYNYRSLSFSGGNITGDPQLRNDYNPPVALPHTSTFAITSKSISDDLVSPLKNFKNPILQSCNINLNFERADLYNFGNDSVCDRKLQFPINIVIQTESIVSGFNTTTENTRDLTGSATTNNKENLYDLNFSFSNEIKSVTGFYNFKNAKLTSLNYSTQVNNIYKMSAAFSVSATEYGDFYMGRTQK
jgi:hypothetical protein